MGYAAKHLPVYCGPAAWNELLEPQDPPKTLNQGVTADVVVIGAGFAGLSAARRLMQLQPTLKVVVLEAGRVAEGSAGRNSGFMIDLPHDLASDDYVGCRNDRDMIDLNRQAIAFGRSAVEDYDIAPHFFTQTGKVNGAASDAAQAHNQNYAKHLTFLGEESQMLDQQQMYELTGSRHYVSGLYTPGTVLLQPAGYIRGLAAGLLRQGVQVFENSPVIRFAREGEAWRVESAKGAVSADRVILTVNGHLESFGFKRNRLMQVFLFAAMTPELDSDAVSRLGGQAHWGMTPSDPMGTTVRRIDKPRGGNRIVVRTCAVMRSGMVATAADLSRAAQVMRRKFDERFPQLAGLRMEYLWGGHLCLSRNSVSVTGQIDRGLYTGCVQNGLGVTRGTLTGIAAAEMACQVDTTITRYFEAEDCPKKIPPQPFRDLGANAILRWKKWRARRE